MRSYTQTTWGSFRSLGNYPDCRFRRVIVSAHQSIPLQSHRFRNEFWVVLHGRGRALVGSTVIELTPGNSVSIRAEQKYEISNTNDLEELELIEIRTGCYLGDNDIETSC